jgi:DNA ligase D-like protein (predicted ligase)
MSRIVKRSASQAIKPGRSQRDHLPQFVPFQLSQPVEKPPVGPQWVHEIKLDGYRMAARIDNGRVQLLTRTGLDWTAKYPSAAAALENMNVKTAYLDGELCGVDDAGLPSFAHTQAATDGERGVHLVYYAFDLLHLAGWDVSSLPLVRRKELLEPLVANKPGLQFNGHDTGDGELILQHAGKLGFEGVVSKTIDAPYAPGNRGLWCKSKALNRQEFVIVGWSDPEGSRPHLGALLLGYYADDGKLIYAGRVGTGMPDKVLADLRRRLEPLARAKPQDPLRLTARSFPSALGRAEARRGDHVFDLDGRQPLATHGLRRTARGQAGRAGAARALASREPLVTRLAAIIDIGGFRLVAVGELGQQVKDLRVSVLRHQPLDVVSPASTARLANQRQRRLADVR